MGVVTGLLLLPITGPVQGFRLLVERLRDEAESVLHDEGRAFAGLLSDDAFAEQETVLLERLSTIREYRDDLLHGERHEEEDESFDAEAGVDGFDTEPEVGEESR